MKKDMLKISDYYLPAEWEKHKALWLSWPYDDDSFPGRVGKVEDTFTEIILHTYKSEQVELLVIDEKMKSRAKERLEKKGIDPSLVNFYIADYADIWFRDFGPIFLIKKGKRETVMIDWEYNGYGKFPELLKDDKIPTFMNTFLNFPCYKPGIVLEGGSIEVNGLGTLMTTEECLLNKNRNTSLNKEKIEKILANYLGVRNFIWLKNGLHNDHTDGHIDNIARFVQSDTIMYAYEEDKDDLNHQITENNFSILKNSKDQEGKEFKLIKMPLPKMKDEKGNQMPASYMNFYIGNEIVLVPIYKHENDETALEIIQKTFPEKKVIGIDSRDIIYGGGAIHCVTHEQPYM